MENQIEEQLIDIREYFYMILRRWWIIAILFVIAIIGAGVVSYFVLEPVYVSKTTLFVGRQQSKEEAIQFSDIQLNQQLVKDYRELAKSRIVAKEVIERLQLNMSVDGFVNRVNINLRQDTRVFELSVSDNDPVLATEIANELADVFIDKATEIMRVENIQVIDIAEVPTVPEKPNPKMNIAIAGVLAIMVGLGIIFLIEYLDNTIKTPNDVEKYLGLHVIGAIPFFEEEGGVQR